MHSTHLTHRLARMDDREAISELIAAAIAELQKPFLTGSQIDASMAIMGLDTQLIADATYYLVYDDGVLAGCGGWSFRQTAYGGDATLGRDPLLLDPASDAARIRAMYTHPAHVRRGIGRLILQLCEDAARGGGFKRAELVATLAGLPLYEACGFLPGERFEDTRGGDAVPLVRMSKAL
jgi:GNAT superfamily N-acetyltransferase